MKTEILAEGDKSFLISRIQRGPGAKDMGTHTDANGGMTLGEKEMLVDRKGVG